MPEMKQASMIQCSHCKLWYHGRPCVKTSDKASETSSLLHLLYARNEAGIYDTVQSLQTLVPWQTLREDI